MIFGDERADYSQALEVHYQQGPPRDWADYFISGYASAHPWEDWAESWAHLLHMIDALETAQFIGLSIKPALREDPSLKIAAIPLNERIGNFERLSQEWSTLTYVLNNLTRGLGLVDAYPIALAEPIIKKLRFVCESMTLASAPLLGQGQGNRG